MEATQGVAERAEYGLETMDMETRIRDIRRRIAEQHTRLGYTQTPRSTAESKSTRANESSMGQTSERANKEAEMNALKAKLMGKKK